VSAKKLSGFKHPIKSIYQSRIVKKPCLKTRTRQLSIEKNMSLNVELLEQSFDKIKPLADEFGASFYEKLFTAHPELKPLFAKTDAELVAVTSADGNVAAKRTFSSVRRRF
jgi:hypothetical protein